MTPSATPAVASRQTTVLYIDDNAADLALWSQRLRDCSPAYLVFTAKDVKSGLNLYQTRSMDCVVVDLDLCDASGFEVLLDLVPDRRCPSIAVIVLTKLTYRSLHEMVVYNGANVCLVKEHTTAQELHTAIQKAIAAIPPVAR